MIAIRRALRRVALASLLSQVALLAGVPVLIVHAEADSLECTCTHGDHAMCPMHHRTFTGKGRCAMRGGADLAIALVPALLGPTASMPAAALSVGPSRKHVSLTRITVSPIRLAVSPDSPPPRS